MKYLALIEWSERRPELVTISAETPYEVITKILDAHKAHDVYDPKTRVTVYPPSPSLAYHDPNMPYTPHMFMCYAELGVVDKLIQEFHQPF